MLKLLRSLFGGSTQVDGQTAAPGNEKTRTEIGPDERLEDVYNEFCATFCFRPDTNLMDYLREKGHTDLINWFHWDTTEPEPKSLIRLFVNSTRGGHRLWEKQGISVYHEGGWEITGGGPSDDTKNALSVLAKIIEKPITVYYTEKQDGPVLMTVFEP